MNKIKKSLLAICLLTGITATAQSSFPILDVYNFEDQSCFRGLSDNGKWAVSYGPDVADGSRYSNGRLLNTETGEITKLVEDNDVSVQSYHGADVTDDGTIVVGEINGKPATWSPGIGWNILPLPDGWNEGQADAVTPDGHYAVGRANDYGNGYKEYPCCWDLTTRTIVDTPDFPTTGTSGPGNGMVRFCSITADAHYIIGCVDYSYPEEMMYFIYDLQTKTWSKIGFNSDGTPWTEGLLSAGGVFSPNGKWFGGWAFLSDNADDESVLFRYNLETKVFEIMPGDGTSDFNSPTIDDTGTLYASTPSGSPVRSLYVRNGSYWYTLAEILKQCYNIDFYSKSGYDNTGTTMGVSGDGKTITAWPDPYTAGYVLRLDEPIGTVAERVNLLNDYTAVPDNGTEFSKMKSITVTFTREVKVIGEASQVVLKDENGNEVRKALVFEEQASNAKNVTISFRTTTLEAGKNYTVTIPEGCITLKNDENKKNNEIVLNYKGRAQTPVTVTDITPKSGSSLSQLDASTNPVYVTFDTNVLPTDTAKAQLFERNSNALVCDLGLAYKDNKVGVFPYSTQYLYLNSQYRIVVNAGSFTDLGGDNPNEEIEIEYDGIYERIIISDDTLVYKEDFAEGIANMLLYEGDENVPTEEMLGYDFTQKDRPWIPVKDEDNDDYAAASTSAYTPAGKSNDWMSTPQIYIPDEKCRLSFDAQGFRKSKNDTLEVYVYPSEETLNYLTSADIEKFKTSGNLVFKEILSPGISEDVLLGEWTNYTIPLNNYAGKNIYIVFANQNNDQSIVFVDNVKVIRDNGFLTAIGNETEVVNKASQAIEGRLIANIAGRTFSSAKASLLDKDKNVIDEVSGTGLSLAKGDAYKFAFTKELPLTVGENNIFYIAGELDEKTDTAKFSIKDLAFKPHKRVVVEEYTGMDCVNCPLGHLAMENLVNIYGERIVPIAYHTYTGDIYESGLTDYTTFLGLYAAPSAKINRSDYAYSPMYDNVETDKHVYTFTSPDGTCWQDAVAKEFEKLTTGNYDILASYDDANDNSITINYAAKFALTADKQNIGLFFVVLENDLVGYQSSKFYNWDPNMYVGLGEWTKGGLYGQDTVYPYTFNHVARSIESNSYYGTVGLIPSSINQGEIYNGKVTFNVPSTVKDITNCSVVSIMMDANTGEVINVASSELYALSGIKGIDSDFNNGDSSFVGIYNAEGQAISRTQKGLNIIRYANGTTKKIIVK